MRISLGDVSLWFDVSGPSVIPQGDTTVERPVLVAVHGGPGLDHLTVKSALGPLAEDFQVAEELSLIVSGLISVGALGDGGRLRAAEAAECLDDPLLVLVAPGRAGQDHTAGMIGEQRREMRERTERIALS